MPVLLCRPLPGVLGTPWFGDEGTVEERVYADLLRAEGRLAGGVGPATTGGAGSTCSADICAGEAERLGPEVPGAVLEEPLEPATVSVLLARLRECDAIEAQNAAHRNDVLVALAGAESSGVFLDEVAVEHEVSVARRSSRYGAGKAIEVARALASTFPRFAAALAAGEVSAGHCAVLVERTRVVSDDAVLSVLDRRGVVKARRLTPGELGRELARLIVALDPDAEQRAVRAREERRVWTRRLDDGLSYLGLVHETAVVDAVKDAITVDALAIRHAARESAGTVDATSRAATSTELSPSARAEMAARTGAARERDAEWAEASLDALRADAFTARMLGRIGADGSIDWDRSEARVVLNVVMDLDTLRAEAGSPGLALVDGTPTPAATARELARAASWWRRLVTDPVEGHLLDYGTATYLPARLRRFVLARDESCRAPGCTTSSASRMQMDHAEEFHHERPGAGGASSSANCHGLCTTCHQLKTGGRAFVDDARADGSLSWVTAWGQRVRIPPRPVLLDPDPEPGPGAGRRVGTDRGPAPPG